MKTWFWIVGWFLSILTITGNGFIIFLVYRKRQLHTKTNAFVVSLAVADFCVGMSVVPSLFFCDITEGCNWRRVYLFLVHSIRWLFGYASVTNLCSLVLDRYIAVVKPLKYLTFMTRRRVIQMIFFSWAIPFGADILPVLSLVYSKRDTFTTIFTWFVTIVFEILPSFILLFCFASMVRVVLKHDSAARTLAKQLRFNHQVLLKRHEKSTVKIMAIVVGLFLLCSCILLRCSVSRLMSAVDVAKGCNDEEYKIPILVLNSAVNPLAYAFYKRDIKKESKRVYKVIFKKGNK